MQIQPPENRTLLKATQLLLLALTTNLLFACIQAKNKISSVASTDREASDFLVDRNSKAALEAERMRKEQSSASDVRRIEYIAQHSVAKWLDKAEVVEQIPDYMARAKQSNKTAVLVVYQIPGRDCGGASAGGAQSADAYEAWIEKFAKSIGTGKALVVLEPDALPLVFYCDRIKNNPELIKTKTGLLKKAGLLIKQYAPNAKVYLDAGHSEWPEIGQIVPLLIEAGVENIDGFTLNVSNYKLDTALMTRGKQIRAELGGKASFILDSSRNGNPNGKGAVGGHWCNPPNSRLGKPSQLVPENSDGLDAYVWIKLPGESDGSAQSDAMCGDGPAAGEFSRKIALDLAADINTGSTKPIQQSPQTPPVQQTPVPQASPIPAPMANPSIPLGSGQISAELRIQSDWGSGYCADIYLSNVGSSPTTGWTVILNKNNQNIQPWNFKVEEQGQEIILKPVAEWNAQIAPGQTSQVGGFCVYQTSQNGSRIQIKSAK